MNKSAKIYVAGHQGLVGSAIWRELEAQGFTRLVGRSHRQLDLLDTAAVQRFYKEEKPEIVFVAAAKVGGILANSQRPAEFLYENLQIQNNVIHGAYCAGVRKLLFLGSSCIYSPCPWGAIPEERLLQGTLEPTNEWYAIAKIAGIKLCQAYRRQYQQSFISAMPCSLYGPNDNYDLRNSHVIPALIRKFHEATINCAEHVILWGTGNPLREFLYVDDLARACIFLMQTYDGESPINIGSDEEISIKKLAFLVREIVGFMGEVVWNHNKPDGAPRKLLDWSKIRNLGWRPLTKLRDGLQLTYEHFLRTRPGNCCFESD